MPRTSPVPIRARPVMPAKSVIPPTESTRVTGVFVDLSFEEKLRKESIDAGIPTVSLEGVPLEAVLGKPFLGREAGSDSRHDSKKGNPPAARDHERQMIRNEIIGCAPELVVPSARVMTASNGMQYRILSATTKEAAILPMGIAASRHQVLPIERFMIWLKHRTVYSVVNGQVYRVVKFRRLAS